MNFVEKISDLKRNNDSNEINVSFVGRVKKVRNLGGVQFLIVHDQTGSIQVVLTEKVKISRGCHLLVRGKLCLNHNIIEIQASEVKILGSNNSQGVNENYFSEKRLEQLYLRSLTLEAIHSYFISKSFMLVHSPSIVGDWVKGRTGSFPIKFYNAECNLTISNMMYHEIMMINGFSKIYELAKIFRQEHPSSIHRLAEFTIIDIGLAYKTAKDMMQTVEEMIDAIHDKLLKLLKDKIDQNIYFEHVTFQELVKRAGCSDFKGAQFPKKVRDYLNKNYQSFVWVTGFPEHKRPFFVKSINGICLDYQLWYQGKIYLAAGGEREIDLDKICKKIKAEGKLVSDYEPILKNFKTNVPPMCGIGMGIERFLACFIPDTIVADYVAFPRYQGHYFP